MLGRIIFCVLIAAAVLAVVLLATVSPLPGRSARRPPGLLALTVYIHPAAPSGTVQERGAPRREEAAASALVFRHRMTAGPETTSRTVGAASGFALLLPGERRGQTMLSVFDTVHLELDGAPAGGGLSAGSICVEAAAAAPNGKSKKEPPRGGVGEEITTTLDVVGGTGAFAFARGHAVLRPAAARGTALRLDLSVTSRPASSNSGAND